MNEPRRLRDDPHSALERSLLEAGCSYTASASTRRRAMAVLGVAGLATTSTATAASLSKAGLVKWAAIAAVAGGGALTAAHYFTRPAPVPSVAPSLAAPTLAAPTLTAPQPDTAGSVDPAPVIADEGPSPSAPVNANAPRLEPKAPAALAAELSALDAARSSLSAGDPKAALASLDAYARSFPRGKLGLEAEVLRIAALAKSGQTSAARSRAEAFIKRHPDSVLASRVRGYVAL